MAKLQYTYQQIDKQDALVLTHPGNSCYIKNDTEGQKFFIISLRYKKEDPGNLKNFLDFFIYKN